MRPSDIFLEAKNVIYNGRKSFKYELTRFLRARASMSVRIFYIDSTLASLRYPIMEPCIVIPVLFCVL
jgi:hypothetical protein